MPANRIEDSRAENVKLRQPVEIEHRRLVRHRPALRKASETPGGRHVVQDVPGPAVARAEEQLQAAPPENCLRRVRGAAPMVLGTVRLVRSTSSAYGTSLSIFSRNNSRCVRCLLDLCSESPNDSDIIIIGHLPNCPRPAVARGIVAHLESNCKPPLPVFNLPLIQCFLRGSLSSIFAEFARPP